MIRLLDSVRHWLPLLSGGVVGLVVASAAVVAARGPFVNLQITSVTDGATVSGVVRLAASADAEGVSSVQFQVDGRALGAVITSGPCAVEWDTRSEAEGPHSLGLFARDDRGTAFFTPGLSVQVRNERPRRARPR